MIAAAPGNHGGTMIARRMVGFLRLLRDNGFAVGIAEALAAARLARDSDLSDKREFGWSLRALLCSTIADWKRFDELFGLYWLGRGVKRTMRSNAADARKGLRSGGADPSLSAGGLADRVARVPGEGGGAGEGRRGGASATESLAETDLRHIADPHAMAALHDLAERLARRMRTRITRRHRLRRRGRVLDMRSTIHRSIKYGGTPLDLKFRRRHPKPVNLVLILDASGSMNPYSSLFVRFIRGVLGSFRQAEAFVFHTRLAHISPALKERNLERALERMAVLASGWSGGTRIGDCLRRFNDNYAADILNSRSVVIVMSDGYDTGAPDLLGAEMQRLKRRARKVVWLNPLIGWDDYAPVAGGMAAALPHIDLFAPAHNLESLMELEPLLARL